MDLAQDGVPEKGSSVPFGDFVAPSSSASSDAGDPFRLFWKLGYRKLLPIIPPSAEISPNSTLFRKVGLRQDGRGKTPGIRKPNGQWISFNWLEHATAEADLAQWLEMGAGVGIRTGKIDEELTLVAIDSDARDPDQARVIFAEMESRFGPLPLRIGRDPKGLCPLLVRGSFPYSRIEFGERDEIGRLIDRVEILSDDRQFVAEGTHPGTGRPYRWERPLVPLSDLPIVDPEELTAFLDALRPLLPAASAIVGKLGSKSGPAPDQKSLIGDFGRIQKAIERLPNAADIDRDEYVRIGVALKAAAGPGYEADARDMFVDWAQQWEGAGEETTLHGLAETAEADFRRFHPPFHLGAEYLFAQAIKRSGGAFTAGDAYFEEPSNVVPLFPEVPSVPAGAATYELLSIGDLLTRPDPVFMLARHIPEASLGFLYGDPGTGKSFIALDWALHIAFGRPDWHGDEIRLPDGASVVYIAAEGASGFKTRVRAWMKAHSIASDQPGRFGLIFQNVNFMQKEDVARLAATLRSRVAGRTCLLVVDTVSRAMPGADENLQKEMTLFVEACQSLQREFGATVLGVHHANKSGDMRGSGVLKGAGDFVFKLERKSGATIGTLRCEKQKDAPDGWSENYRLDDVHVDEGQISLVPFRCEVPSAAGLTPDLAARVLDAIEAAWTNGAPWSASYRSKDRYAVNRMCREFDFAPDAAKELLAHWLGTGVIEDAEFRKKDHSKGLRVCVIRQNGSEETDSLSETEDDSVFD